MCFTKSSTDPVLCLHFSGGGALLWAQIRRWSRWRLAAEASVKGKGKAEEEVAEPTYKGEDVMVIFDNEDPNY